MAERDAGAVGIDVVPKIDAAAWGQQIKARLDPTMAKTGRALGGTLAEGVKAGFSVRRLEEAMSQAAPRLQTAGHKLGRKIGGSVSDGAKAGFQPRRLEEAMSQASPRLQAAGTRLGRKIGAEIARSIKAELEAKLKNLPEATVRVQLEIDEPSLERVRRRLSALGPFTATINVDADTAAAMAKLMLLRAEADRMFGRSVSVNVGANTAGASRALMMLGLQMAALSSIPLGAALAAGIGGIAASATAAAAGIGGILAVAIPGVRRVSEALQAQKTAENQVTQATRARTVATNAGAIAAAQAQLRTMQMAQAERQVTTAQRAARAAQADLNAARRDGARTLQDMQNQLIDAGLSLRGDELAVLRAKQALDELNASREDALAVQRAQADLAKAGAAQKIVLADPKSTQLQKDQAKLAVDAAKEALRQAQAQLRAKELARKEAQLAYEQAVQQLRQQRIAVQRLAADEARARKAGVEGTEEVRAAKERLAASLAQVAEAQRAVRQQQIQDRIAALQQADAQRQAAAAADGASAASVRLGRAMDKLTPAEKRLLDGWQSFSKVYRDWVNDLEPDVLPVLSGGLGLVAVQLEKFSPMIRSSSAAFRILEARAAAALDGPFWTNFINNLGIAAPQAILGFGAIAGHTLTGVAGIFNAFLPWTGLLLDRVDRLAQGFADWGTSLGASSGFIRFMGYVQQIGPEIVQTLGSLGSSLLDIGQALAPLAAVQLLVIRALADGLAALARTAPGLIQLAAAAFIVSKAIRVLAFTSLIAGLRGTGAAAGAASAGMVRFGMILRALGGALMGVRGAAVTTRVALLGLAAGGAHLAVIVGASYGVGVLQDKLLGTAQSTTELSKALIQLGESGRFAGALTDQFKAKLTGAQGSLGTFKREAKQLVDPTVLDRFNHAMSATLAVLPGVTSDVERMRAKFKSLDTTLVQMMQSGQTQQAAAAYQRLSGELAKSGMKVDEINRLFPQYTALSSVAKNSTSQFTAQIQRQNQALLTNTQRFISDEQQVIDFNNAINAGRDALNRNGTAFYGNSRAASDNRQQILSAARVVQGYSDDLVSNNRVTDASIKRIRSQRDQLVQMAQKFGLSRAAAEKYVDQLVKIPKKTSTSVSVNAKGKFSMKGLDNLGPISDLLKGVLGNAGGGYIRGGGGPRDDGYLTRISAGEMVVNAPATARHLPLLAAINDEGNRGTIYKGSGYRGAPTPGAGGATGAFAGGGLPAVPRAGARVPGFAGGGVPKGILASSYNRNYNYDGESAATLKKAAAANASALAGILGYTAGQTAVGAAVISQILSGGFGSGSKAVQFAQAQLGEPYVWGATGPNSWDCSGLTQAAWNYAGVKIPRVTYDQIAFGTPSTKSKAMPGDLVFPHRGHVMMATGMGGSRAMIHAPQTGDVVRFAPWRDGTVRHIAGGGGSWYGGGSPKGFARDQLGEMGWSSKQWPPLDSLWQRESGWRWNARNPSSGAYGIPQALPASKMASFGNDWRTNWATQIRWGLNYIKGRYGSPSGAWRHSQRTGWYASGTDHARRGLAWVGENGPELVDFRGGEQVHPHEESMAIAAAAAGAPLGLLDTAPGVGEGGDHFHAHFDGMTQAAYSHHVRTAFTAMQVGQAAAQRIGRNR